METVVAVAAAVAVAVVASDSTAAFDWLPPLHDTLAPLLLAVAVLLPPPPPPPPSPPPPDSSTNSAMVTDPTVEVLRPQERRGLISSMPLTVDTVC